MYDKSNTENREAIKALTIAVDRLCDKMDEEEKKDVRNIKFGD